MFKEILECFASADGFVGLFDGAVQAVQKVVNWLFAVLGLDKYFNAEGKNVLAMVLLFVTAVVIGVLGYRAIKLWTGLFAGVFGFKAAVVMINILSGKYDVVKSLPVVCKYIIAVAFAVILFVLGVAKFSYTWFTIVGLLFGIVIYVFLFPSKYVLLVAILLFGTLAVLCTKTSIVGLSSLYAGGAFTVAVKGLVNVNFINNTWVLLGTTLVVALCFGFIQLALAKQKEN